MYFFQSPVSYIITLLLAAANAFTSWPNALHILCDLCLPNSLWKMQGVVSYRVKASRWGSQCDAKPWRNSLRLWTSATATGVNFILFLTLMQALNVKCIWWCALAQTGCIQSKQMCQMESSHSSTLMSLSFIRKPDMTTLQVKPKLSLLHSQTTRVPFHRQHNQGHKTKHLAANSDIVD